MGRSCARYRNWDIMDAKHTHIYVLASGVCLGTFVFSFQSIRELGEILGLTGWMSVLLAPLIDLSIITLIVASHELGKSGQSQVPERVAQAMLGLATLAANVAPYVWVERSLGRAVLHSIAPIILVGLTEFLARWVRMFGVEEESPAEITAEVPIVEVQEITEPEIVEIPAEPEVEEGVDVPAVSFDELESMVKTPVKKTKTAGLQLF